MKNLYVTLPHNASNEEAEAVRRRLMQTGDFRDVIVLSNLVKFVEPLPKRRPVKKKNRNA